MARKGVPSLGQEITFRKSAILSLRKRGHVQKLAIDRKSTIFVSELEKNGKYEFLKFTMLLTF